MSLDRLVTRATLTPGPSSSSKRVTVGPTRAPTRRVSTPWAASARTSSTPAASVCFWSCSIFLDSCSNDPGGSVQPPGRWATAGHGRRLDRLGVGLRFGGGGAGSGMSMSLSSTGSGSEGGPASAKGETGAGEAGSSWARAAS